MGHEPPQLVLILKAYSSRLIVVSAFHPSTQEAIAFRQAQGSTSTTQVPNPRETASEPVLDNFVKKVACDFIEYREEKEPQEGREGKPQRPMQADPRRTG